MNTLNQLPPGTQAALDLINDFDQCFLTGFANLEYPQQQSLSIWQQVFAETPLQQPLNDSCRAIQANEFLERYFAILAVVRAAMQGMLFDTLQQQVSNLLGRTQLEQINIEDKSGELPAHLSVWLESVRHWLMEIALVGYARLESATLVPFLATLEQIQGEPLLIRQSALLTGFFNELMGLVPIADTNTIPLYRWVDLWSQAMIVSLQPIVWDIPDRTSTKWLYGVIPSSFVAIEYQFRLPAGTVSLAEISWKKSLKVANLKPLILKKEQTAKVTKPKKVPHSPLPPGELGNFLVRPPSFVQADTEQLLQWCADIVALSRNNGYLASTADAIAIYQTSLLLARIRQRSHPTPMDFQDAAITCLEKDRTPKKRNISQICQILLGGDRTGTVGYSSLPPLAQNVYDRLAPLEINLLAKTNQRALMDFKQHPGWLACSEVLWRLNYLLGDQLVQPIMGERRLGFKPIQESWEIRIGKYQGQIIILGYEGITIEQVLEQRLRQSAFDPQAKASTVLRITEDSVLYLASPRLTQELGEQAIALLKQETGVGDAPQVFESVRRLVHYYRATPTGLPKWIQDFVITGYGHYSTLLPQAFADRGTTPEQIAGMLSFIFTLESLALSLGCNRSQLFIGVQQAGMGLEDPAKLGLLWTTEWLLSLRTLEQIRDFFDQVMTNPMLNPTFPDYLNGFILALTFAPRISRFIVELLSKVFASVPDHILLPWLPNLILRLRPHAQILQTLIKEASANFPQSLSGFANWKPVWVEREPDSATSQITESTPTLNQAQLQVRKLLFNHTTTMDTLAKLLTERV